ncbi:MAG TPA: GH116 family glycosyl-hydrolase [Planctomycetota bacterium]|jgi:uncharacterized protein (DUF608 family)
MSDDQGVKMNCSDQNCDCHSYAHRREFLKLLGLGSVAALAGPRMVMAGPFSLADFEKLVPPDKKLSPEWVKSLYERGARTIYRGAELEKIGMPVGGICAGQVYLGGDGKLWHWDIFNQHIGTGDAHYRAPMKPSSPFEQGFAVRVTSGGKSEVRALDKSGFSNITFCGEYPIGFVEYKDDALPVAVSLEAFSPFVPLNAEDSALPATVMRYTLKNTGKEKVELEIAGWLQNAIGLHSKAACTRTNKVVPASAPAGRDAGPTRLTALECGVEELVIKPDEQKRPDIVFEDFEKEKYEGWTVTGTAFGDGPIEKAKMPAYQGDVLSQGKRLVNSHNTRNGEDVAKGDAHTGKMVSKTFTIERNYITFLIGGGNHKGKTCINLLVDAKVVDSATGKADNRMFQHSFDVSKLAGKQAQLEIVDDVAGPWGNIGIDDIVFTDQPRGSNLVLKDQPDYGGMLLALLDGKDDDLSSVSLPDGKLPEGLFAASGLSDNKAGAKPNGERLVGAVGRKLSLDSGKEATVTFVIGWRFPNLRMKNGGRFYASRFESPAAVAEYIAKNFETLYAATKLWHDTWYDSTLPYWFLDRTFLNTSILATSTSHWFHDGRFYGWEGVGCCEGTCTHVWHYAHAVARIFPQLERDLRQRTDFGTAYNPANGIIQFRGEGNGLAIDGQSGCILRAYREHQISADDAFLKKNWPQIKGALLCLMKKDAGTGILDGNQHNTLDTDWFGPVTWLTGLYLGACRAAEAMAREMGDEDFAKQCGAIVEKGSKAVVEQLFNGEYFINKPDPKHLEAINSGSGCHIDQVMGQSWAFQVNLPRVLPAKETLSSLKALWRYNFAPDVGPYRAANKPGRWYAMAGEAGLLMCTFPRDGWNYANAKGKGPDWAAGYFNECMNGFEYQVAWHMIWEGMVQEGLAITRAIHDRYYASRRNPFNEVECGDHYARSMASYGVFLAACGFEYHGPKAHIGFSPRLTPENFRSAFTSAEGWGTFTQKREGSAQRETIELKSGRLRVRTLAFAVAADAKPGKVSVTVNGNAVEAKLAQDGARATITLSADATIQMGQKMEVAIG